MHELRYKIKNTFIFVFHFSKSIRPLKQHTAQSLIKVFPVHIKNLMRFWSLFRERRVFFVAFSMFKAKQLLFSCYYDHFADGLISVCLYAWANSFPPKFLVASGSNCSHFIGCCGNWSAQLTFSPPPPPQSIYWMQSTVHSMKGKNSWRLEEYVSWHLRR